MASVTKYGNSSKASSSAKKRALRPCQLYEELDKISQLPEPLIDKILSLLLIRDAVRTSILTSKWRFKWTTLSKLVFDDDCTRPIYHASIAVRSIMLVNVINDVLLIHLGPIEKFKLSHRQSQSTTDIDRWILYLSKASISEFSLDIWKGLYKRIQESKDLVSLVGSLSREVLQNLISGSCLLEKLTLHAYHFRDLIIDAPKLEHLEFSGVLEGISFNNKCCSPSFHMDLEENGAHLPARIADTCYISLLKFFAPLQNVELLRFDGHVLQYLSVQDVPTMLPEPFVRLNTLVINCVDLNTVKDVLVILCLLRSAPNLKHVKLGGPNMRKDYVLEVDDDCSSGLYGSPFTLGNQHSASLINIHYSAPEVGFIGVLLSSSPALQKITIRAAEGCGRGSYKSLKRRICNSTQAKVVFLNLMGP